MPAIVETDGVDYSGKESGSDNGTIDLDKEHREAEALSNDVNIWWNSLEENEYGEDPKEFYGHFGINEDTLLTYTTLINLLSTDLAKPDPSTLGAFSDQGQALRYIRMEYSGEETKKPSEKEVFGVSDLPSNVDFVASWKDGHWNCSLVSTIDDPSTDVSDLPYYQK